MHTTPRQSSYVLLDSVWHYGHAVSSQRRWEGVNNGGRGEGEKGTLNQHQIDYIRKMHEQTTALFSFRYCCLLHTLPNIRTLLSQNFKSPLLLNS